MSESEDYKRLEQWFYNEMATLRGERYATHLIAITALGMLLSGTDENHRIFDAIEKDLNQSIDKAKIVGGGEPYDTKIRESARFHVELVLDELRRRVGRR